MKLSEFDKKMNDLEIMTTLFEAKLESLPDEIKSSFPPLQSCSLDDLNLVISANSNSNNNNNQKEQNEDGQNKKEIQNENKNEEEEDKKKDEKEEAKEGEEAGEGGGEQNELSPEEDLRQFLDKNTSFSNLFKMLKIGVPVRSVEQKAKLNGFDMDLLNELVEKAKKAYPNIN